MAKSSKKNTVEVTVPAKSVLKYQDTYEATGGTLDKYQILTPCMINGEMYRCDTSVLPSQITVDDETNGREAKITPDGNIDGENVKVTFNANERVHVYTRKGGELDFTDMPATEFVSGVKDAIAIEKQKDPTMKNYENVGLSGDARQRILDIIHEPIPRSTTRQPISDASAYKSDNSKMSSRDISAYRINNLEYPSSSAKLSEDARQRILDIIHDKPENNTDDFDLGE